MKTVLIFEAHSDDCVMGMGGTVQKLKKDGYKIILITFTTGATAYSTMEMKDKIADIRVEENQRALEIIGVDEHINWKHGCQSVEDTRAVHQDCIEMIRKYKPEIIFTHYFEDKHRDHRAISATVTEAWWKATEGVLADRGEQHRTEKLFYFETTELFTHPDVIIDISPYYDKKIEAMLQYESQFDVCKGMIISVEGKAKVRAPYIKGIYGEAFIRSDFLPSREF